MKKILKYLVLRIPIIKDIIRTSGTAAPITMKTLFFQKILGINRNVKWPVHFSSVVTHPHNIKIGIGTAPGLSHGCYIQGGGKIEIGDYTIIAPNVGLISSNHDIYNYKNHIKGAISIGRYCWVGMNSSIMPNVKLGDHTIVAANSVVTKSFEEGFCVIGGNPARLIKHIEKDKCVEEKNKYEYYGYYEKTN